MPNLEKLENKKLVSLIRRYEEDRNLRNEDLKDQNEETKVSIFFFNFFFQQLPYFRKLNK